MSKVLKTYKHVKYSLLTIFACKSCSMLNVSGLMPPISKTAPSTPSCATFFGSLSL